MITEIEDFFDKGCGRCPRFATAECSTRLWEGGLRELRRICRDEGLEETVKWGHPCYMHAERNIAIIGAYRGDFQLVFFNAALMKDPHGLLTRTGPNSRHPDKLRFTDNAEVAAMEPIIRAYLAEAMAYAREGLKPEREVVAPDFPQELTDALDADPVLANAFRALTPGRQRSYLINLNGAKKSETRMARISAFRDKILAGKGALDR